MKIYVDIQGNILPCEKTYRIPIIGNLVDGLDWEKINKMEEDYLRTSAPCHECWALSLCRLCWVHVYRNQCQVDQEFKRERCNSIRSQIVGNLKMYTDIKEKTLGAIKANLQ